MLEQHAVTPGLVGMMAKPAKTECVTVDEAVEETKVSKATLYNYINVLGIERYHYPLDRRAYVTRADVQRIKQAFQGNNKGVRP